MNKKVQPLWKDILDFELDDSNAPLTFTDRLARENGWTHEFAVRAVIEYKKFIFLICLSDRPLTPSDQVDQVWHLHLLYTRSYWDEMCAGILKKKIHHGPTKGGQREGEKFTDWYLKTLAFYRETFEEEPPRDLWPDAKQRFSEINFQRVNRDRFWLVRKFFNS
ncbi:MAG: hypothetical protein JSS79_07835 [Bacteroidetes bacterium]|nr:hypothetical protein [Bacteroidota bacterium]